ncbi:MAG TPA: hypothetical protein VGS20_05905 [Candidatus Acidoferrales bacterium]|nr:hypothetical protein [Candidatus Acidoferrales bacterium]
MPPDADQLGGSDQDNLGFQPLAARPRPVKPAPAGAAPVADPDNLGFQPLQTSAKPPAAVRAVPASGPTIRAYQPSFWQRAKDVFTQGVPRYSTRTVYNPRYGENELIAPEEALSPAQQHAHPAVAGALQAVGGMTSPENAAILAASGGLGELPGAARAVVPRLVSAGFTAGAIKNAWQQNREFQDALKRGDTETAYRILGQFAVNAAVGTLAGKHAMTGEVAAPLGTLERSKAAAPVDLAAEARAEATRQAEQTARQQAIAGETARLARPALPARISPEPPHAVGGPSAEAVELPPPTQSPEGATIARPGMTIDEWAQRMLPEGTTPEEYDFLAGRPTPTPRLPTVPGLRPVEESDVGFSPVSRPSPAATMPAAAVAQPVAAGRALPAAEAAAAPTALRGFDLIAERLRREGKLPSRPVAAAGELAAAPQPAPAAGEVTPVSRPAPIEKIEATAYQKNQARLAVNRIRNPISRGYADDYLKARLEGGAAPDRGPVGGADARAIRMDIDHYLAREQPKPAREQFPADVIEEAESEMRAADSMLSSMDPTGRYRRGPASGLREDESKFDSWFGIGSARPMVSQMYPWYADEAIATPGQLAKAVEKGKGADYERIVRHIAEGITAERESAAPVVAEFAPRLRELSSALRTADPALSETLASLADGKLTLAAPKLRAYLEGAISDAETKANAAAVVDAAGHEARSEAGLAEAPRVGGETRGEPTPRPVEPAEAILPGMESALEQERQAAAARQGQQLTEQLNLPAENVEAAAGQMERLSPLFRGTAASPQREIFAEPGAGLSAADVERLLHDESGASSPELLGDLLSGRLGKEAWQRFVASPLVRRLGLGDKYEAVKQADPALAEKLHLLDNAVPYFRAKADRTVQSIISNLSRAQERLFVLMADADSRENLEANHPAEYQAALRDPAIQDALRKYRPIEQELTAARKAMGGETLDQEYLRRVYETHVAGIGKEQAPGQAPAAVPFDRVVPQRVPNLSREASAEYHYENGLHEFGPAFGTKYLATQLAALRDSVARDFIDKATELSAGSQMPRSIDYEGKTYYRPDVAAEMRRDTPTYHVYNPTEGLKFPAKAERGQRYLGPAEVVDALRNYGTEGESRPGALSRFLQEQVVGFGLGIPHVANILRRVTQGEPLGALNPKAWADAWNVLFDRELRTRGIRGLDDPTFDRLAKYGATSPAEMRTLKAYWGGNLNPANWARSLMQIGHRLLFEPGSFGGLGGIDQRARIWTADLVKSQRPDLSDAEIAEAVNTQLGQYNRRSWTETQKRVAPFMLFPGWSLSSMRWVIEHPVKTVVPPAVLVLLANQVLQQTGFQKQPEDAWDISNVHIGDRSIGVNLLRESMARNLLRPALGYAQSEILGEHGGRAVRGAVQGIESGAAGLAGTLNPVLTGAISLATNRQDVFNRRELMQPQDWNTPGVVLPNRALDNLAALVVRHAVPSLDRILEPGESLDFASFAGGNVGLPNYSYGPEQRLKRNAAEATETYQQIQKLARTNHDRARDFVSDPENAALLVFHSELEGMASTLKRIDAATETVKGARNLTAAEKAARLAQIQRARTNLLRNADGLDRLLFQRMRAPKPAQRSPAPGQRAEVGELVAR